MTIPEKLKAVLDLRAGKHPAECYSNVGCNCHPAQGPHMAAALLILWPALEEMFGNDYGADWQVVQQARHAFEQAKRELE